MRMGYKCVSDIQQGLAIAIFIKKKENRICHFELLYGGEKEKIDRIFPDIEKDIQKFLIKL